VERGMARRAFGLRLPSPKRRGVGGEVNPMIHAGRLEA
jgi:hypothetical protein